MSVKLTAEKCGKISRAAEDLLKKKSFQIQNLAEFIGQLVAAEPGVQYAAPHYKPLEVEKTAASRGLH